MARPKPKTDNPRFEPEEGQREAMGHVYGPMLVVAGAGTGKTTVLTRRIARLVSEGHSRPDEVLALTYTDNAAREMRERIRSELRGADTSRLQVTTFHAYCNNLLIRCGKEFGVLDDQDLWIYLRKRIRELHLNYFIRAANVGKFLADLIDFMRRCQDELVGPEKYAEYVQRLERGVFPIPRVSKSKEALLLSDEEVLGRCREIAGVLETAERMLSEENLGTFGHMISKAYELLSHDSEVLARERKRARFILVDEFQDANFAQVKLLQKLAGEERNVFAVGDPDQAIYQFRGASSAAFEIFQLHFPAARLVALDKNRRSSSAILKCAFALICKNPESFSRQKGPASGYRRFPLVPAREEDSLRDGKPMPNVPVETVLLNAKEAECPDLVNVIRKKKRESGCAWKEFAVLYRQHSHRDQVAAELSAQGVPFAIENMDVLDTPQARDLFACLGALVSENDGASLFRVAALPQFAIDPEKLRAGMRSIPKAAASTGVACVLRQIAGGSAVLEALGRTRQEIAEAKAESSAALEITLRHFQLDRNSPVVAAVLDFVRRWEKKPITKTKLLAELLEYVDYFRQANGVIPMPSRDEDAVRLITAHSAKGLEFSHVFILRANSNSFPSSYKEPLVEFPRELRDAESVACDEGKILHDQEERRLFYVAMTRARDSLTIYARQGKGRDATPAGFLRDLLKDPNLGPWLQRRPAEAFQTDLFAESRTVSASASRTSAWLALPTAFSLDTKLSATAIEIYETCPLQFKLEREWRIPREVPAAMQYGATMHRVLRAYYDSVLVHRPLTDEALVELFRSDLEQAGIPDGYQRELYEEQGIEQLRDFLAASRRAELPAVLHTEESFEVRIGDTNVAGRIDRIDDAGDGKVVITDYKTGKPKAQEDADKSLQLSIYALAAREKWGYRSDRLVFYNLEENSGVVTRRSDLQLQDAEVRVEGVAKAIAAGNFDAKPGYHCTFCHYRNLCPATEKILYLPDAGKKRA